MPARELYPRIIKDNARTITLDVVRDGLIVSPDAAPAPTVTIVQSSDGTALPTPVLDATATIATSGQLSFAVIAANTATEALYKSTWKYRINGVTEEQDSYYRVVKTVLDQLVIKRDLDIEVPRLANKEFKDILWSDFIDARFEKVIRELRKRGIYDFFVMRSEDLFYVHLYTVIMDCAINFREEEGDVWDIIKEDYKAAWTDAWDRLTIAYDQNQDGNLDEIENIHTRNQIRLNR